MSRWQCRPSVGGKARHILGPTLSEQPGGDEGQVVALQGGNILRFLLTGLVLALPGNQAALLRSAWHRVVQDETEEHGDEHRAREDDGDD